MYESFSFLFLTAAVISFINDRWIKLPLTIAQLLLSLGLAVLVLVAKPLWPAAYGFLSNTVTQVDFNHFMLDILLGFLLFAGALHVDIRGLEAERWPVFWFATLGVLLSTVIIGAGLYGIASILSVPMSFFDCLLFGALISPTDPVAVLALLRESNVSPSLQLKIEGESLFNDGVGVIVFTGVLLLSEMSSSGGALPLMMELGQLFLREVFLGLSLGALLGFLGFRSMKMVDHDPHLTTMVSLAIVFGGYSLAQGLETSGPLAMVVAGLYIGNQIKQPGFEVETRKVLHGFWEILDDSFNGILFVFLGLAIHLMSPDSMAEIGLMLSVIVLVLASRFAAVVIPYSFLRHDAHRWVDTAAVLTWGGLRGGISLALAFSLTENMSGSTILLLTYGLVIFSILVQGLTLPKVVKALLPSAPSK